MLKLIQRGLLVIMVLSGALIIDALFFMKDKEPTLLNPIVRLTEGGHTYCTGTVIDTNTVVTASHCVVQASFMGMYMVRPDIEIRANDDIPLNVHGKVTYLTTQLDTAIIKGDFKLFEPRKHISNINKLMDLQTKGRKFLSCGYPLGGDMQCTKTIFLRRDNFMQAVDGLLLPGMSGGPTMLEDGTVIAVNVAVEGEYSIVAPIFNIDFNMSGE